MKKKCKFRRYCLSAKDLRQRYDEDIEEAMEDGFQGPVAKALHAFEFLQALVIVVLMMATLTLLSLIPMAMSGITPALAGSGRTPSEAGTSAGMPQR